MTGSVSKPDVNNKTQNFTKKEAHQSKLFCCDEPFVVCKFVFYYSADNLYFFSYAVYALMNWGVLSAFNVSR